MKPTILHIIESLAIGGAEVLLTESLKDIDNEHYRHLVVYMRVPSTLLPEVKADKIYCLGYKGKRNIVQCILRLHRIILQEQVNLIHSHHYWPTIVARLAKPGKLPLLFTVHSPLGIDAFKPNCLSLYLERLTYRKSDHAIFITENIKRDYITHVGSLKGGDSILNNFATEEFYKVGNGKISFDTDILRLVAVGTLKEAKNYIFLLNVMDSLNKYPLHLDIIGDGPLKGILEEVIKAKKLNNVKLLGSRTEVYKILKNYDAFILTSTYEGMSLAVIEAMAIGLPCILSNIESNRETTDGHAVLIDLESIENWKKEIIDLIENLEKRKQLSLFGKKQALKFNKQYYLDKLEALYRFKLNH